jgi:redox-sensing transcriptional repressor
VSAAKAKNGGANGVPESTVHRLPVYLRVLVQAQALQMPLISSGRIAEMAGTNAAQVRKDFSYLGELGTRGTGYDVDTLIDHVSAWLGLTRARNVAIVGFGRLGGALRSYGGFMDRGFSVVAVFDAAPDKIGQATGDLEVSPMNQLEQTLRELEVDIVVIATPAAVAQDVCDRVVVAGVSSILNFAPVILHAPDRVLVRQVELGSELQILSFHLARSDADE